HEMHEASVVHGGVAPRNVWLSQGFLPGGVIVGHPAQYLLRAPTSALQDGVASENVESAAPYLSPEQIQGEAPDVRSDLYAVGVVLYELLTGKALFDGSTADVLNAHVNTP